ncbi:Histidine biosynthesis bifunctional protein hisB [Marasmius crinis-equi]|uniref:Histidine biosynthesis bifunctional protein hisB n=1 Tax=Marasmius crinis-equi TaxID=585013 RepID=A0ABR3FTR1_9AGAR
MGLYLLDYGAGNVQSLANSLKKLGYSFQWISNPSDFEKATSLIFPGVGAFETAVANLRSKGLFEPLRQYILSGKPYFGICIGMQVLFESSAESPSLGLGIIPSPVERFEDSDKVVPHMGWNAAVPVDPENQEPPAYYYFVHSYCAKYDPEKYSEAAQWAYTTTQYGNELFISAVQRGNVFGSQFHPEKSGHEGLELIKRWLQTSKSERPSTSASTSTLFRTCSTLFQGLTKWIIVCMNVIVRWLQTSKSERPSTSISSRTRSTLIPKDKDRLTKRIIACMDVRTNDEGDLVVTKGDQYDVREKTTPSAGGQVETAGAVRNLGKPVALASTYYTSGADELCLLNITSFRHSPLLDQPMLAVVRAAAECVFVPLTIGGGIKDTVDPDGTKHSALEVASEYFRAGADKVSLGSDAVYAVERLRASPDPTKGDGTSAIETIAHAYGRQAVVVSIDPKRVYVDDPTTYDGPGKDELIEGKQDSPIESERARGVEILGAGELLVNSIDRDGTGLGFDLDLIRLVRSCVKIPVVASSGAGKAEHFLNVFQETGVEAALAAGIFHRKEVGIDQVKECLKDNHVNVRMNVAG